MPRSWGPSQQVLDQVITLISSRVPATALSQEAAAARCTQLAPESDWRSHCHLRPRRWCAVDVCVLGRAHRIVVDGEPGGIEHLGDADVVEVMTRLVLGYAAGNIKIDPDDPRWSAASPGCAGSKSRPRRLVLHRARRGCARFHVAKAQCGIRVEQSRTGGEDPSRGAGPPWPVRCYTPWRGDASDQAILPPLSWSGEVPTIPLVAEMLRRAFSVPLSMRRPPCKHNVRARRGAAAGAHNSRCARGGAPGPRRRACRPADGSPADLATPGARASRQSLGPAAGAVPRQRHPLRHTTCGPRPEA